MVFIQLLINYFNKQINVLTVFWFCAACTTWPHALDTNSMRSQDSCFCSEHRTNISHLMTKLDDVQGLYEMNTPKK
jgi:hypothetical protein